MKFEHQTIPAEYGNDISQNQLRDAYLVFSLDNFSYAIGVDYVSEIITAVVTSPVPGAPAYLTGVTNLRGRILPMVDLRKRFQLREDWPNERDCYVILVLELDDELVELGIRVDSVDEVSRIAADEVDDAGSMTDYVDKLTFDGVAKTDSGVKLILDAKSLIRQLKNDVHRRFEHEPENQPQAIEA